GVAVGVSDDTVTMLKWVVPVTVPSFAVTVTWEVAGEFGSVPLILPLVVPATALIFSPAGSPVALHFSAFDDPVLRPVIFSEKAVPGAASCGPGSTRVSRCAVLANAAVPFGVPRPVGPSKPFTPWQRYCRNVSHLPLTPAVTSNRWLVCR